MPGRGRKCTSEYLKDGYETRAEYLRVYQRNRYQSDDVYRQKQLDKVKARYYRKKEMENNICPETS
jgi:glutathionyl-hydroquinone reductase